MRALVTGGAGLIGSAIVDKLLESGHEVISLDNYSAGKRDNLNKALKFKSFREVQGDVRDERCLNNIFSQGIDWVFHEAVSKNTVCLIDPKSDLLVNALGTLTILQMSLKHNVKKFIHASTGSVYGRVQKFPTFENDPLNPVSFYGNSKLAAENYVNLFHHQYNLPVVVLRYFHVYGSRQDSSDYGGVIPLFIRKALSDETISVTGDGKQIRAFTFVEDVANINLLAADSEINGEIINCASNERVDILSLANLILQKIPSSKSGIEFVPERLGDIHKFDVSNSKLSSLLNFANFTHFEDGLEKTIREMIISRNKLF